MLFELTVVHSRPTYAMQEAKDLERGVPQLIAVAKGNLDLCSIYMLLGVYVYYYFVAIKQS